MNTTIRQCLLSEVDTLQAIASETYNETFRAMNTSETMDTYLKEAFAKKTLRAELQNKGCRFYFLCFNHELAGYLKINEAPSQSDINDAASLEIERIYIRKDYKGKGLGKCLMDFAFQKAAAMEKDYLWLGVWEENSDAIAFYKKLGFQVSGRHSFQMGDELQSDLIMKKRANLYPGEIII